MKYLLPMVAVVITRDPMTILPRDLPAHEVPVAQAVFGEDNVEVGEPIEGETVEIDVEGEADRLSQKYGQGAIEAAFGVNFKAAISKACKAEGKEVIEEAAEGEGAKPKAKKGKAAEGEGA